ncbi:MAG: glycosyltransferase [Acidobacteriota bacterium]
MEFSEINASSTPLVSVVIPTYNSAAFLSEAITSVLNQTYRPVEIIVIDDGSTDNTETVAATFKEAIRYSKKANGGPSAARNVGIRHSSGEFIAFLDADDLWLPDKLELQIAHFNEHPEYGVVFTGSQRFNESGVLDSNIRAGRDIPTGMIFDKILLEHFIAMPSVMVRRRCLDEVGLFDEGLIGNEDFNFYLRLAKKYPFGFVNKILVHIRCHDKNLSDNLEQMCNDEIKNLEKIAALFPDEPIPKRRLAGNIYARFGRYYFSQQRFAEARRCFRQAFRHWPWQAGSLPFFLIAALPDRLRHRVLSLNKSLKKSVR